MLDRVKRRHIVLLSLLAVIGVVSLFYLQSDRETSLSKIRPYDPQKDYLPLVKLMNDNKFMITERPEFSPEDTLNKRIPTNDPDKRATIDVAEADGQTAGFIAYYKRNARHGFIWLVAVDKNFRGRGLGEQLVIRALKALRDQGAQFVTLATRTINKPALGLYKKLGFVEHTVDEDRGIVTLVNRNP